MATRKDYTSENIQSLGFPDNIRAKPGMYMGAMGSPAVMQCLREILDNCVDECLAGHCSSVDVVVDGDEFHVIDNGRGIPVGFTEVSNPADGSKKKIPTLRAVFSVMHTSGKFDSDSYKTSRGCFTGDTKIRLLNGSVVSFKKLYERWMHNQSPIEVMSFDIRTRSLVPSTISHVQLTKKTRDLIRVTIGDSTVSCTPDHKFYVNRGGSIKAVQAQNLSVGDSLVSTYYGQRGGYPAQTEEGRMTAIHRIVGQHYYGECTEGLHDIHHISRDIRDNRSVNLQKLSKAEHQEEHSEQRRKSSYAKIMSSQSSLRAENSLRFQEQNSSEDHKNLVRSSRILRVAQRVIANGGSKVTAKSYDSFRDNGSPSSGKVLSYYESWTDLTEQAKQRLHELEKTKETRLTSKRELEKLQSTDFVSASENSQKANWIKSVENWSNALLSCEDPFSATIQEFNSVNKTGVCVFGRYASMSRFTTLKWLKDHVLRNKPLRLHEDLSLEAQELRKIEAEARVRPDSSTVRVYRKFLKAVWKTSIKESDYTRMKTPSDPQFSFGMECLRKHFGEDFNLEEMSRTFNHEVSKITRVKLPNSVPVYDMTVENTHVFFVEPGVLVANSHGAGSKGSNALSDFFRVRSFHSKKWSAVDFEQGNLTKDVRVLAKPPLHPVTKKPLSKGTIVSFTPDYTVIGKGARLSMKDLVSWSQLSAYFTPGASITLYLRKDDKFISKNFCSPRGPIQYVEDRIETLQSEKEFGLISTTVFQSSTELHDCVIQFTNYDGCDARAFTNGLENPEGGTHLSSVLSALKDSLTPFCNKKQTFTLNELKDGLIGIINVKLSGPKFASQTKEKLVDERAADPLREELLKKMKEFFSKNKKLAADLVDRASRLKEMKTKFVASKQMLTALKKISQKGLPAKAATAPKCKPQDREIYLLEGDSAAGGLRHARDESFQEFLPMKGKPKNCMRTVRGKAVEKPEMSEEILNIFAMIGFDPKLENPYEKLRAGKIIIMSDSDPDGFHISSLVCAIFYKYLPELFTQNRIFVTRVPEYYALSGDRIFSGSSLEEVQDLLKKAKVKAEVNHVKGYGEIDSDLLRVFACDPKTRCLYNVQPSGAGRFELLMGSETATRKELLGI